MRSLLERGVYLFDLFAFSGANFLLTIVLSRYYTHEQFAAYGTGISIALIVQAIQRGIYVTPTALQTAHRARRRSVGVAGEHIIVLGIASAMVLVAMIAVELLGYGVGYYYTALATLAFTLIYMQADFDRYMFAKKPHLLIAPALASMAYAVWIAGASLAAHLGWFTFDLFMWSVVVFALAKAGVVAYLAGGLSFRWGLRLLREDIGVRGRFSLVGALAYSGYNNVPILVLASTSPAVHTAAFVALRGLIQPLALVLRSLDIVEKSRVRDRVRGHDDRLRRHFWRTLALSLGVSLVAALAVWAVGVPVERLAFGDNYLGFEYLLLGHTLIFSFLSFTYPLDTVVNIKSLYRSHLVWRVLSAGVAIALAIWLAPQYGAWGALISTVAGWTVAVLGGFYVVRRYVFRLPAPPPVATGLN